MTEPLASGFFATKDTLPKDAGKDSIIKTTLRELLIYLTFLVTVSISKLWSFLLVVLFFFGLRDLRQKEKSDEYSR